MQKKDPVLIQFLGKTRSLRSKIIKIYLFGSRARGTERPDSDYDLLLIVKNDFSLSDKSRLYDGVIEVLLDTGRLVSLKILREKYFEEIRQLGTPFIRNVLKEGLQIG